MNSCSKSAEYFFAGSGGITAPVSSDRDPFEVLDDLMVVIEALRPTWPPRESIENTIQSRL